MMQEAVGDILGRAKHSCMVATPNRTYRLSFTSQPLALHTLVSSVMEGKQEQEWTISLHALVFCFREM